MYINIAGLPGKVYLVLPNLFLSCAMKRNSAAASRFAEPGKRNTGQANKRPRALS